MNVSSTKTKKISILLADDHQMLLDLWHSIFCKDDRYDICGKAVTGTIAVEMAKTKKPDIVLLDISMGPIDGFEVTRLIRQFSPSSKIIAVSKFIFPAYAKRMKALGAMGYVTKDSPADELFSAILEVSKGNFYLCEQIQKIIQVEKKMYPDKKEGYPALTSREIEILQLIMDGLTSNQIGEKLFLSPRTINIHRHNIFRKLNVTNVSSLITTARSMGL
ncbi:MAG: response regulator transcription factor [Chitinophagaceae bacterium]